MSQMTTQEAIQYLTSPERKEPKSMYAIAKVLQKSPIMVGHYKYGRSKMGLGTAKVFEAAFGIEITDASSPGRQCNEHD